MTISQREARRLKKRVRELEEIEAARRRRWVTDWPGGVNFWTLTIGAESQVAMTTARMLGHYVVALPDGDKLRFYAVKHDR